MTCKHFKIKEKFLKDFAEMLVNMMHRYFSSFELDIKEPFLRINLSEALQMCGASVEIENKKIISKNQILNADVAENKIA